MDETCRLGDTWRTWDFLSLPTRVLPVKASPFNARKTVARETQVLGVTWERGRHDALYRAPTVEECGGVDWRFEHGSPSHTHAEFDVDGHREHLDRVGGRSTGPGAPGPRSWRSWTARAWPTAGNGGCSLGFGGLHNWPVVVAVAPSVSLKVGGDGEVTVHKDRR